MLSMITSSNGNIFLVTGPPMTRSFDVFFDLRLNKQLSKEARRRWFKTPLRSLWRHYNVIMIFAKVPTCQLVAFVTAVHRNFCGILHKIYVYTVLKWVYIAYKSEYCIENIDAYQFLTMYYQNEYMTSLCRLNVKWLFGKSMYYLINSFPLHRGLGALTTLTAVTVPELRR